MFKQSQVKQDESRMVSGFRSVLRGVALEAKKWGAIVWVTGLFKG